MDLVFDGKTYSVALEPQAVSGEIKAKVNEESFSQSVIRISDNTILFLSSDKIQKTYVASDNGKVIAHIDGKVVAFDKAIEGQKSFSRDALEYGSKDQVSTPMPGKVVKILVKEGDHVTLKQPLVIVESMKMENELKSPSNGVIKSIHFAAGDLVGTGQPIIRIEPEE
jgi:biotin carboxyl carrier protein